VLRLACPTTQVLCTASAAAKPCPAAPPAAAQEQVLVVEDKHMIAHPREGTAHVWRHVGVPVLDLPSWDVAAVERAVATAYVLRRRVIHANPHCVM